MDGFVALAQVSPLLGDQGQHPSSGEVWPLLFISNHTFILILFRE